MAIEALVVLEVQVVLVVLDVLEVLLPNMWIWDFPVAQNGILSMKLEDMLAFSPTMRQ